MTEVLDLIKPELQASESQFRDGCIDLLGEESAAGSGAGQRLMESAGLVMIYERLWRPVLGRLLMGVLGPGMRDEQLVAVEMLDLADGDRVLDVACGPGNFTRAFAREDQGLVVGLDASSAMLARAVHETREDNVAYVRGNASAMPFIDGAFDGVCCFAALYLIEDPFAAIDEMVRVLAPGGRLAILTSVNRGLLPAGVSDALSRPLTGVRIFGRDDITDALRQRGLDKVAQRVTGLAQFVSARRPA